MGVADNRFYEDPRQTIEISKFLGGCGEELTSFCGPPISKGIADSIALTCAGVRLIVKDLIFP
jgi:hypothetical protein